MSPASQPITHVSDTALWVAMYRAMETERPDAHFRDPYARRLAGERGEQILRTMPKAKAWGWPMVVRTCVFDELIVRAIERDGVDTVLDLAAGLDTRPYRLPLPRSLRWIDVDLPDMIAYKQQQLTGERPACAFESATVDLTDVARRRALFAQVGVAARQVLVVTEGLLVYLTADQVASLADDLHAQPSFRWWVIDIVSPRLLAMIRKTWGKPLDTGNARMQFAPEEGTAFYAAHGWKEAEFRATWDEAHRLKREMPLAWLWRLLARFSPAKRREEFRRMSGVVRLERV